jgi:hypothetical protein
MPSGEYRHAVTPGDWREATRNIEDELEYEPHLNGHGTSH